MPPASLIPGVKAALFDALTASSELDGVDVLWDMGMDVGDEEHTVVAFIDAASGDQRFAGIAGPDRQARDEPIRVRIGVRHVVYIGDDPPRTAEGALWRLVDEIDELARHTPAIRQLVERVPRIAALQQTSTRRGDGSWDLRCEITVAVNARIRP